MSHIRFWSLFFIVWFSDLITKSWAVENSAELKNFPFVVLDLIDGNKAFLEFTYITNPGAAWSMLSEFPQFLTALAIIALISIYLFRHKLELHKRNIQIAFGLISGGIAGNLTDRIFRQPAEVVDFIDIFIPILNYDYPVFNINFSNSSRAFKAILVELILTLLEQNVLISLDISWSKNSSFRPIELFEFIVSFICAM